MKKKFFVKGRTENNFQPQNLLLYHPILKRRTLLRWYEGKKGNVVMLKKWKLDKEREKISAFGVSFITWINFFFPGQGELFTLIIIKRRRESREIFHWDYRLPCFGWGKKSIRVGRGVKKERKESKKLNVKGENKFMVLMLFSESTHRPKVLFPRENTK